jgi:hypothetical protein
MRKLITAATAAILTVGIAAAPASAKKVDAAGFSYIATIDCGSGNITVGSSDDMYAPLVDLKTGKSYLPIAWHVRFGDQEIVDSNGVVSKKARDCSYDDGFATGTVTVIKGKKA